MSEKEKFYRVTYDEEGIYSALKKQVNNINTWNNILTSEKINWLPKPPSYKYNNRSYFTELGYRKFTEETLPIIYQYLGKEKIKVESFNSINNVIYNDKYQVVTRVL